jgi:hypothetical protein
MVVLVAVASEEKNISLWADRMAEMGVMEAILFSKSIVIYQR